MANHMSGKSREEYFDEVRLQSRNAADDLDHAKRMIRRASERMQVVDEMIDFLRKTEK